MLAVKGFDDGLRLLRRLMDRSITEIDHSFRMPERERSIKDAGAWVAVIGGGRCVAAPESIRNSGLPV